MNIYNIHIPLPIVAPVFFIVIGIVLFFPASIIYSLLCKGKNKIHSFIKFFGRCMLVTIGWLFLAMLMCICVMDFPSIKSAIALAIILIVTIIQFGSDKSITYKIIENKMRRVEEKLDKVERKSIKNEIRKQLTRF